VLVRGDLPPGLQLAQVAHASSEFALRHPTEAASTPIGIVLEVPDEDALLAFADVVASEGVPSTVFREEDLDDEATAMAVVCDGRHFSSLPLAGRRMAGV
jgi:hypothetical protein